jgi:hypothetical protein
MQQIQLNIIPFTAPVNQVTFSFYKEFQEGHCPMYIDTDLERLLDDIMTKNQQDASPWLYTDFGKPTKEAIILTIDLSIHTNFAAHYYRHLIFNYFKNGTANIMHRNFIKEIEVWILNENSKSDNYNVYNQFTIKVQHNKVTDGPELVLSFDGRTKVYKQSVSQMVGFPTEQFNWMNCDGVLHKWKKLPDGYKLKLDKVFPVVSNKLKPQLGIRFDTPDLSNRYPKYFLALNGKLLESRRSYAQRLVFR